MELGPADGQVHVHTTVAGAAARMGHNLDLVVDQWRLGVDLAGLAVASVSFQADLDSLRVASGSGGLTPLTARDRRSIRDNARRTLRVDRHPQVRFASEGIRATAGGLAVSGLLEICGHERPLTAHVDLAPAAGSTRAACEVPLLQSSFGITAYSTMLGRLRVADEVTVFVEVVAPIEGPGPAE